MQTAEQRLANLTREIGALVAAKLSLDVRSPEDDLLAAGLIDSMTLIDLLVSLEEEFGIRIPLDELQIEDVRSISSIARLVEHQRFAQTDAGEGGSKTRGVELDDGEAPAARAAF